MQRDIVRRVAFQGATGDIMLSQWNSSTNAWNVTNFTVVHVRDDPRGRLIPRNGTSLSIVHSDDPVAALRGYSCTLSCGT